MKKSILAVVLALVLCIGGLTACGSNPTPSATQVGGGTLIVSVNPEIAVEYDEAGVVTGVSARNDDAIAIIASCEGLIGQPTRDVVTKLVNSIGAAGYFVEEVEGAPRQITIEIEAGSGLPTETFLDEVITDVRSTVSTQGWHVPTEVLGESDYGMTDFVDTDYGPDNDGDSLFGDDTDYGPDNDGVTDFADGQSNFDSQSNYDDTDYGPNNDGVTDFGGQSNYNDPASNYSDPASNYSDPASNYGSDYDD